MSCVALPKAGLLRRARARLKQGGVIAYATESCFGLGCDPRNARALKRVLAIKGRPTVHAERRFGDIGRAEVRLATVVQALAMIEAAIR